MSTARAAAAVLVIAAALAALFAVLAPGAPAQADPPAPAAEERTATLSGFLPALAPDSDFTPAQAEALTLAADRVCDGFTADVPVVVMVDTLMADLGLTGPEARRLVEVAGVEVCGL
jgi:hypothetical protein